MNIQKYIKIWWYYDIYICIQQHFKTWSDDAAGLMTTNLPTFSKLSSTAVSSAWGVWISCLTDHRKWFQIGIASDWRVYAVHRDASISILKWHWIIMTASLPVYFRPTYIIGLCESERWCGIGCSLFVPELYQLGSGRSQESGAAWDYTYLQVFHNSRFPSFTSLPPRLVVLVPSKSWCAPSSGTYPRFEHLTEYKPGSPNHIHVCRFSLWSIALL